MRGTPPFGHDHWPCALVLANAIRLLGDPTPSRSRNLWKSSHKGPESGSGGPTRNNHMAGKTRGNERQGAEATQKRSTPPQLLALSRIGKPPRRTPRALLQELRRHFQETQLWESTSWKQAASRATKAQRSRCHFTIVDTCSS
jgi:hypothetical protein